jgi:hypothetical protein
MEITRDHHLHAIERAGKHGSWHGPGAVIVIPTFSTAGICPRQARHFPLVCLFCFWRCGVLSLRSERAGCLPPEMGHPFRCRAARIGRLGRAAIEIGDVITG